MKGLPNEWLLEGLDGADGWSVLEIICHLRDYQAIFAERIRRILEEEDPTFRLYDEQARLALVIENDYANQDLRQVLDDYRSTRCQIIVLRSSRSRMTLAARSLSR